MAWAELIIGNLVLASLIGALALFVGRHGRRAALAHALWIMFFAKLITPPIVSVPLPIPTLFSGPTQVQVERVHVAAAVNAAVKPTTTAAAIEPSIATGPVSVGIDRASSSPATALFDSSRWGRIALAVWIGGFCIVFVRGMVRLFGFRRLIADCGIHDQDASETVQEFLRNHRRWLLDRPAPRVVRVSIRVSPMLFGFATRPIIVCPESLWQSLSTEDRRAFLAHETAHFHRRDHWVRWLQWIVSAVYWWFPGVYFAQKQLERHEEACCDAWAVKMLGTKPRCYAEALLRVVDFISDHAIGLPSFASGMQPTDTLEERLRLLMRNELDHASSRLHTWGSGLACAAIWMVHPDAYHLQLGRDVSIPSEHRPIDVLLPPLAVIDKSDERVAATEEPLPTPPSGFWNSPPIRDWAGFSFEVSGYRFSAIAGRGFIIDRRSDEPLVFDDQSLTAIAEIPASGRVIIGDAQGNVRLWDLSAGMPVSLLGRHNAPVSSVTVAPDGSVFSADSAGSVIRWELQSGLTIARWTAQQTNANASQSSAAVQSIRLSNDGRWISVLCGDWRQASAPKALYLLDTQTLTEQSRHLTHADSAVVLQDQHQRWNAVSWSGIVRAIDSFEPIDRIEKHRVSGLVLSQHAAMRDGDTSHFVQ